MSGAISDGSMDVISCPSISVRSMPVDTRPLSCAGPPGTSPTTLSPCPPSVCLKTIPTPTRASYSVIDDPALVASERLGLEEVASQQQGPSSLRACCPALAFCPKLLCADCLSGLHHVPEASERKGLQNQSIMRRAFCCGCRTERQRKGDNPVDENDGGECSNDTHKRPITRQLIATAGQWSDGCTARSEPCKKYLLVNIQHAAIVDARMPVSPCGSSWKHARHSFSNTFA